MQNAVLYIHGKGGSAEEAAHYEPLFPDCTVVGLDYRTFTPWETGKEIREAVGSLQEKSNRILLIANSIGAYFCMHAALNGLVQKAFFISPVVDMEQLIESMMRQANVTEAQLQSRGVIPTGFGEDLSWEYLRYVRTYPVDWAVPTHILCGAHDALTPPETIRAFAQRHNASLTVMENGEHWFHTPEQMRFLDDWIRRYATDHSTSCSAS